MKSFFKNFVMILLCLASIQASQAWAARSPMTLTLTNPVNTAPPSVVSGTVQIQANVSGNSGTVRILFYIDGKLISSDNTAPYAASWDTTKFTDGSHTIKAQIMLTSISSTVNVTVNNAPPPPPMSLSIASPLNQAIVPADNLLVKVNASPTIVKTEFFLDSVWMGKTTVSPFDFTVNLSGKPSGSQHAITARAYDASGADVWSSNVVAVTIAFPSDTTPPTVSIASPSHGASVSGTVTVTANAQDDVGVTRVEFLVDGVVVATDPTPPTFSFDWNTTQDISNGNHQLKAVAYDAAGHSTTSTAVQVVVENVDPEIEAKITALKTTFDYRMWNWQWWKINNQTPYQYFEASAATGYSVNYYSMAQVIDGTLSMFEATQDLKYLNLALRWIEKEIAMATILNDPNHPEWRFNATSGPSMVYDLTSAAPFASVARSILQRHPELISQGESGQPTYGQRASAIIIFVDQHILRKYLLDRGFGNYSTGWEWMIKTQDEPLGPTSGYIQGHQMFVAEMCRDVYASGITQAKRNGETWNDLGVQIAQIFKQRLVIKPSGAYVWEEGTFLEPQHAPDYTPDVFHTNIQASMVALYYQDGLVFSSGDMWHFSRTMTDSIGNGQTTLISPIENAVSNGSMWFRNYINGSDLAFSSTIFNNDVRGANGAIYFGWCKLGQFDLKAQAMAETMNNALLQYDGSVNGNTFANGNTPYARLTLIGHLARNLRFRQLVLPPSS